MDGTLGSWLKGAKPAAAATAAAQAGEDTAAGDKRKATDNAAASGSAPKRTCSSSRTVPGLFSTKPPTAGSAAPPAVPRDPRKIVCWNVNGLHNRLLMHGPRIREFMQREQPDVLFVSEVKLVGSSRKRHFALSNADKKCGAEAAQLRRALAPGGCLDLFGMKKMTLANKRYAGTAMFVRGDELRPLRLWYHLAPHAELADPEARPDKAEHDEDGRVLLAEWKSLFTLHTYTPNNGSSEPAFQRRRTWDARITEWLRVFREKSAKPLIYCGDLNCAPGPGDLSHPAWFARQFSPAPNGDPGDAGQPGCTPNEQKRFARMLEAGGLIDAYRLCAGPAPAAPAPEAPLFTWRGHPGKTAPEAGKYFGRAMRIDHFLVSAELEPRVGSVRITGSGRGADDPSFLGSDHCPMVLELLAADSSKRRAEPGAEGGSKASTREES